MTYLYGSLDVLSVCGDEAGLLLIGRHSCVVFISREGDMVLVGFGWITVQVATTILEWAGVQSPMLGDVIGTRIDAVRLGGELHFADFTIHDRVIASKVNLLSSQPGFLAHDPPPCIAPVG